MSEALTSKEKPSNWVTAEMTAEQAAAVAKEVSSEEWTYFDTHFFQSCCDCGLSHRVNVRRSGEGFEVQCVRLDEYTDAIRKTPRFTKQPQEARESRFVQHSDPEMGGMCGNCGEHSSLHRENPKGSGLCPEPATPHEPKPSEATAALAKMMTAAAGQHAERVVELEAEVSTLREHLAEVNRLLSLNVAEVERLKQPHEPGEIRSLFNTGIGVLKDNRFSFSFETNADAERAFHYIADLGTLETGQLSQTKEIGHE